MYFEGRTNESAAILGVCEERNWKSMVLIWSSRMGNTGKEDAFAVVFYLLFLFFVSLGNLGDQNSIEILVILQRCRMGGWNSVKTESSSLDLVAWREVAVGEMEKKSSLEKAQAVKKWRHWIWIALLTTWNKNQKVPSLYWDTL